MQHLVHNIKHNPTPTLPGQYSKDLRHLVQAMLAKKHTDRPSINTILSLSLFRERMADILDEKIRQVCVFGYGGGGV